MFPHASEGVGQWQGGGTHKSPPRSHLYNEKDDPEDPSPFKLLEKCPLGQSSPEYIVLIKYLSLNEIAEAPKERTRQLLCLMTVISLLLEKAPHPNSYQAIVVLGLEI